MKKLLINIWAYSHHAKFQILANDTAKDVENAILDKLGENSIKWEYLGNNYLTAAKKFFIKTDVPNGLKHFSRSPIKTSMEGDFDTGNVRYKARERYVFGFSDPRGIFGSNAT